MPTKKPGFMGLSIKVLFTKFIMWCVNKVDFSQIVKKIARSKAARPLNNKFCDLPPNWENREAVSQLAAKLTCEQLVQNGEKDISTEDILPLIRQIEIKYDRDQHIEISTALGCIFDQFLKTTHRGYHLYHPTSGILPILRHLKSIVKMAWGWFT